MIAAGVVGLALGELWGIWFPINKNLWTSSYVLFTGGFALIMLGICYWLVEVRGWRRWGAPFLWYGSNALAVFALSTWVGKYTITHYVHGMQMQRWIYQRWFAPLAQPINASLLYALAYVITFLVLVWILYRRKLFIKI